MMEEDLARNILAKYEEKENEISKQENFYW
jgi:hypothetical protein